ncbi:MAG TPA: carbon storage regulator [Gammaproteobacteria bacterium]|nr:carbon storage regulator [Gammaproteobacteria bacterium]
MLPLIRCVGRPLIVGDDISMTVLGLRGNHVRIGTINEARSSLRRFATSKFSSVRKFFTIAAI